MTGVRLQIEGKLIGCISINILGLVLILDSVAVTVTDVVVVLAIEELRVENS
jgi:hypothetical protein